jgi:hypothetical protein
MGCGVSFISRLIYPGEEKSILWVGGWVDPSADLDVVEKKKSCPTGDRTPVVQPVA